MIAALTKPQDVSIRVYSSGSVAITSRDSAFKLFLGAEEMSDSVGEFLCKVSLALSGPLEDLLVGQLVQWPCGGENHAFENLRRHVVSICVLG